jgi:hypothetical protein
MALLEIDITFEAPFNVAHGAGKDCHPLLYPKDVFAVGSSARSGVLRLCQCETQRNIIVSISLLLSHQFVQLPLG